MRVRYAMEREGRRVIDDVVIPCAKEMMLYPGEDEIREASSAVLHTAMAGKLSIRYARRCKMHERQRQSQRQRPLCVCVF